MRTAPTAGLLIALCAPLTISAAGCESPPMDMWISKDRDAGWDFDAPARESRPSDDTNTSTGGTGGGAGTDGSGGGAGTGGAGGGAGTGGTGGDGAGGTGGDAGSGGGAGAGGTGGAS